MRSPNNNNNHYNATMDGKRQVFLQYSDEAEQQEPERVTAKLWWRTKALHYQNLAKFSCTTIDTLKQRLERRESQLRELVALVDIFRAKCGMLVADRKHLAVSHVEKGSDEYDKLIAKFLMEFGLEAAKSADEIERLRAEFWRRKFEELSAAPKQSKSSVMSVDRKTAHTASTTLKNTTTNNANDDKGDLVVTKYIVHTLNQTNMILSYPGNRGTATSKALLITEASTTAEEQDVQHWKNKFTAAEFRIKQMEEQSKKTQQQFGELLVSVEKYSKENGELETQLKAKVKEVKQLELRLSEYQSKGLAEIVKDKTRQIEEKETLLLSTIAAYENKLCSGGVDHAKETRALNERIQQLCSIVDVNLMLTVDRMDRIKAVAADRSYMIACPTLDQLENDIWQHAIKNEKRNLLAIPKAQTVLSPDEHLALLMERLFGVLKVCERYPTIRRMKDICVFTEYLGGLIGLYKCTDHKHSSDAQQFIRKQSPHLLRLYHCLLSIITMVQTDFVDQFRIQTGKG